MTEPIHVISCGGGVQSTTMCLMAARGEIGPMPVAALFADTGAEPESVYRHVDWLEKQLPFPLIRVAAKRSLTEESLLIRQRVKGSGGPRVQSLIPAFVKNPDGTKGIMGRSCTADKKIAPLLKKERELANVPRGCKEVRCVTWIGISLDEVSRMKPARDPWVQHRWPLIEKEMTRHDCLRWMERNGYPRPPRSACVYCPFHNDHEWRRLKTEEPQEFAKAVQFERDLQKVKAATGQMHGVPFLHGSLTPLDQVDFSTPKERGQDELNLFNNECSGMCGI